ncbi:MAG: DUF72 domain-containing protein [Bryobacteraceae bacterium]
MAQLFAGTSGFAYANWKPAFYPAKLPAKSFLQHYATRLNAVEINYTFRRMPSRSTLEGWVGQTEPGFVFALKAHQRITHIMRLRNAAEATTAFLSAIDPLRVTRRIGPILFQLPPNLKSDIALLSDFLAILPDDLHFTFEFRNPSWLVDTTYELLAGRNIALCLAESDKLEVPKVITADFVYCRLRKADYPEEARRQIRAQADELLAQNRDVFVFFKHEDTPDGALYAEELLRR